MAEKDNTQDLAHLGFTVNASGAQRTLDALDRKIKAIDRDFAAADASLERKIHGTLEKMAKTVEGLDGAENTVAGVVRALQNLANVPDGMKDLASVSQIINRSIEAMRNSGLDKIADHYATSLGKATKTFGELSNRVRGTAVGLSDLVSGVFDSRNTKAVDEYIKRLQNAYDQLSRYTDPIDQKKLPFGVTRVNIEEAQAALTPLIEAAQRYRTLIDPKNGLEKTAIRNSWKALEASLPKKIDALDAAMDGLFPTGGTVKINAEIANADQITAMLPNPIRIQVNDEDIKKMAQLFGQVQAIKDNTEVTLSLPPVQIDNIRTEVETAFKYAPIQIPVAFVLGQGKTIATVNPATQMSEDAKTDMADALKNMDAAKVMSEQVATARRELYEKLADEAWDNKKLRAEWRGENAFDNNDRLAETFADAVNGEQKAIEELRGLMTKLKYGKEQIAEEFEFANIGESTVLAALPKEEVKPAEVKKAVEDTEKLTDETLQAAVKNFKSILSNNEDIREIQQMLSFKPTFDTSELDRQMQAFKPSLPENWDATLKSQLDTLKSLPVETVTVSPKTLTVDTSASVATLIGKTLHVNDGNVLVHPKTVRVDTMFIDQTAITLVNPKDITVLPVDNVTVKPSAVTIDLSSIDNDKIEFLTPKAKVLTKNIDVENSRVTVLPEAISILTQFIKSDKVRFFDGEHFSKDLRISDVNVTVEPASAILDTSKMTDIVTQIGTIDQAYKDLTTTVNTLKDAVKELEGSMSKEVRSLIKGEQRKSESKTQDPEKAAAADAEKIKKKAEAEQAALDALLEAQKQLKNLEEMMQKSPDDKKLQDKVKTYREQIENLRKAVNADPTDDIQKNVGDLKKELTNTTNDFKAHLDSVNKTLADNNKNWSAQADAIKKNAQSYAAMNALTGKAVATTAAINVQLRTSAIETNNLIRVRTQLLTLPDPFAKLKAEIGETNSRLADLGRAFGLYFSGRSIINYFRQASESANNFQYEIRRIQSLATDFDFGELRNGLMDIDARFGNVIHNSQALYWAFSSGVRGTEKELVKFTETMSKTATAIKADVMPTLDAATSVMNAWGLSASSAAEIGDLLFGIVKYGKSNAQQLTTSLGHVVAPAAALNIELNELGAAAATLTKTMKTNRAFTYLSNILGKMASPTKAVQEAAAELGVELSASAIKARGFANTLKDIREATGGDIGKIAKLFPDLRGQRAAITLLSTQYKDFEQQLDNMRNKAGSMEEALSKITDTPEAQIKALRNTFSMLSIEAGNTVNSMLTLGGALGPILKGLNDLGHNGRTILGNLAAAGAAWGGMAVTAKAFAVAQYAALQTSYQMAMSSAEIKRNEMDAALLKEKQALEANKLLIADMKAQVAAKLNNDEQLRMLNAQKDSLNERLRFAKAQVDQERLALKIQDEYVKRQVTDTLLPNISASKSRIVELRSVLAEVTKVGDGTQETLELKRIKNLNLIKRLQSDISIQETKNNAVIKNFMNEYDDEIKGFVMQNEELRKLMHTLRGEGNVKAYLDAKNTVDTIVNTIKKSDVLANQVAQYGLKDDDLQILAKKLLYEQMRKDVQSGELFSQEMLIKLLKDEIAQEDIHLQQLEAQKRSILEKTTLTKEDKAQLDKLTQAESVAAAESRQMLDIVTQIERRTDETTGRMRQQIAVIGEAVKVAKEKLDQDTQEAEVIRKNLEMSLKQATFIGKETLAATQSAMDAHMEYQSMLMQENELQSEIDRIVDRKGNLIDDSADAQERLNVLLEKQKKLQLDAAAAQERFTRAGILAGNQNAVQTKINQFNALPKVDQTFWRRQKLVNDIQLNPKVASEMMRAMAKEMGGMGLASMFGGNAMRVATMGMSFMPGMQKWALPLTMASQFNVVGKAQKGFAMLTGTMVKMLGSTQKLQSKGFMVLDKNMVDLTKTIIQNISWTKKQALANKALMAMSTGGQQANAAIAGQAALISGLTAGIGVAIIAAIAGSLWWALSKTEKGGPFGEIAEKIMGAEGLQRYGDVLEQRIEQFKMERNANMEMQREMRRLVAMRENDLLQNNQMLDLAQKSNDAQEHINRLKERSLHLQSEYNKLQTGLGDLAYISEYQKFRKQLLDAQKEQDDLAKQNAKNRVILASPLAQPGVMATKKQIEQMVQRYEEMDSQERAAQEEVNKLTQQQDDAFNKMKRGIAEFRYQSFVQQLETSRDAAFTAAKNAEDKVRSAERMMLLSRKRIESILSTDEQLVNLSNMATDDLMKLINERIQKLSDAYEDADKKVRKFNDNLKGKDPNEKQQKELSKLEKASSDALQELNQFQTNAENAYADYYQQIFNRARAEVEKIIEQSGKAIIGDAKKGEFFKSNSELIRTLPRAQQILKEGIAQITKDYEEGLGFFADIRDDMERMRLKDDLIKKAKDAIDKNTTTLISTTWSQLNDDVAKMMSDAEIGNMFENYDNIFDRQRMAVEKYRDFIGEITRQFENNAGLFADIENADDRMRAKENLIKMAGEKIKQYEHNGWMKSIVSLRDSMSSFGEQLVNEVAASQKELFDFRLNLPANVPNQKKMISQRLSQLTKMVDNSVLQRDSFMELANIRFNRQDYAGAQKAWESASKYSKEAKSSEREMYDLLKKRADIEKDINSSMYQLAATLQNTFQATSQTAVELDSLEAVRLMSRNIGENLAAPTSMQEQTRADKFWEQMLAQDQQFAAKLAASAQEAYQELNSIYQKYTNAFDEPSRRMDDASIRMKDAAILMEKKSQRPLLNVKRI